MGCTSFHPRRIRNGRVLNGTLQHCTSHSVAPRGALFARCRATRVTCASPAFVRVLDVTTLVVVFVVVFVVVLYVLNYFLFGPHITG